MRSVPVEDDVEVDVHYMPTPPAQQHIIQVAVAKAQQPARLRSAGTGMQDSGQRNTGKQRRTEGVKRHAVLKPRLHAPCSLLQERRQTHAGVATSALR